MWGKYFGGYADEETTLTSEGYQSNIYGLAIGFDSVMNTSDEVESVFGVAASYALSKVESANIKETDINSYQLSLYNHNFFNSNKLTGYYNDNILSLAYHQYDSNRQIEAGSSIFNANSNYGSFQYGAKTGIGYNFDMFNRILLSPNISIKYSALDQDDYQETGAGNIGLNVQSETFETLMSDVGIKLAGKVGNLNGSPILPELTLSWSRNLITDGQEATSRFIAGGDEFISNGSDLDEDFFNLGMSIDFKIMDSSSLQRNYDLQKSENFQSHIGYLKYRFSF
jgi:outer membrane autotransporter protein